MCVQDRRPGAPGRDGDAIRVARPRGRAPIRLRRGFPRQIPTFAGTATPFVETGIAAADPAFGPASTRGVAASRPGAPHCRAPPSSGRGGDHAHPAAIPTVMLAATVLAACAPPRRRPSVVLGLAGVAVPAVPPWGTAPSVPPVSASASASPGRRSRPPRPPGCAASPSRRPRRRPPRASPTRRAVVGLSTLPFDREALEGRPSRSPSPPAVSAGRPMPSRRRRSGLSRRPRRLPGHIGRSRGRWASAAESRTGSLGLGAGHPPSGPGPCLGARLEGVEGHARDLQRPPEPLEEHVVHPSPLAVHRDLHAGLGEDAGEPRTGELAALVGVEDLRPAVARHRAAREGVPAAPRGLRLQRAVAHLGPAEGVRTRGGQDHRARRHGPVGARRRLARRRIRRRPARGLRSRRCRADGHAGFGPMGVTGFSTSSATFANAARRRWRNWPPASTSSTRRPRGRSSSWSAGGTWWPSRSTRWARAAPAPVPAHAG